MNILAGIVLVCASGTIGIYAMGSLRQMTHKGVAHFIGDWRHLRRPQTIDYCRDDQPLHFWIAIAFNAVLATTGLSILLLALLALAAYVTMACCVQMS